MITTIALDLDNTLLNSAKEISAANQRVLTRLHQEGKRIVLCTGRPLPAIEHLLEQLGLTGPNDYSITFNGGLVQNNQTGEILAQTTLDKAAVELLTRDAAVRHYPLDVLGPDRVYSLTEFGQSKYEKFMNGKLKFAHINFADLPENEAFGKVVSAAPAEVVAQTRAGIPAEISEHFNVVPSRRELLEFLPEGVNKAVGLSKLLTHFGESMENLMTFGDEENDLEMIMQAQVGVAMDNAIPLIKDAADVITLDNDSDGVAVYLQKYFQL
ncbi:haloacid dehalogenase [Ligilactobacillus salitolerans]|uniref:Haloacid dehalogenase n=1 Tax=Ligilactobacillus salitolerans TaxID=1808352 RepID=A0A401IRU0_9LACO|nr:Cof-type HAD-IIB family hydrolase [Ligilactobacillus salitolerans]GBG94248.1 haloacid dehalogenase [Ligilactobacillus salitolerans]